MKTIAIIINYFTSHLLPPLLEVLNNDVLIHKIVVADNSREDVLPGKLKKFTKARLISFQQNIGFAAAVNRIAATEEADYYLLINPDTLPDVGFLERLIEGMEDSDALIAGPRFYWDDKKTFRLPPALGNSWWIQNGMDLSQHSQVDAKLFSFDCALYHERFWNATESFSETFLSGACMLIKNDTSFFRNGRIFDERYFLYYEDTDLCMKVLLHNKIVVCIPDAEVVHYWDQSPSGEKSRLMAESHDKFMLKHYGGIPDFRLPQQMQNKIPEVFDLGEIEPSTSFSIENDEAGQKLFFEIGLNPYFVPFAQADAKGTHFQIPQSIISRLKPGEYYSRMRNSRNKTLKIWKWRKL